MPSRKSFGQLACRLLRSGCSGCSTYLAINTQRSIGVCTCRRQLPTSSHAAEGNGAFHHHISTAITNPRPLLRHDTESPTAPGTHRVGSCPQGAVRHSCNKNRLANAIRLCGLVVAPPCPKRCQSAHRDSSGSSLARPVSPIPTGEMMSAAGHVGGLGIRDSGTTQGLRG